MAVKIVAALIAAFSDLGSHLVTLDQIIAISASLGSLAAAFATYLTVREMRAGRVSAARARLTTPGTDESFEFEWKRSPKNRVSPPEHRRILIRNASAGVARDVRVRWESCFNFTSEDLESLQGWLSQGQAIELETPHTMAFLDSGTVSCRLVVAQNDTGHLTDLGPNQEAYVALPTGLLNLVFMKWFCLLTRVANGEPLSYADVPLVRLTLSHDSPYEKAIVDSHLIRFELVESAFIERAKKSIARALGGNWNTARITLAFETTSPTMYDVPKVVVGAGTHVAG